MDHQMKYRYESDFNWRSIVRTRISFVIEINKELCGTCTLRIPVN